MILATMPQLARLADELAVPDGGFTVDIRTNRRPTSGYIVSIHKEAERILDGEVDWHALADFVEINLPALLVPGRMFGGWRDPETDLIYLDVSVWAADRAQAELLAIDNFQQAIYDVAAGASIYVLPTVRVPVVAA